MIINTEREPKYSLFYIGSVILEILNEKDNVEIDMLYEALKEKIDTNMHIDFLYFSLDWLYILSKIRLEKNKVIRC